MASHRFSEPGSRIRLLELDGTPAVHAREWAPLWIEALIPDELWSVAELRRGDELLPLQLRKLGDQPRVVAEWPRSGPGNYQLQLRVPTEIHQLSLTIRPEKISQNAFARLLEDVETRLPAAVALGLQRVGGLAGLELLPPERSTLAEELIRLQRAVLGTPGRPGLSDVLVQVAGDPHQILQPREYWVRRHQARRPHPARLALAVSRSGNLAPDLRPVQVLDTRVEHTVDVYENRLVRTFFEQVDRRLRRLTVVLESTRDSASYDAARTLMDRLTSARRRATFLSEVSQLSHAPDRVTMVLLNRPAYRAALEGLLEFQRSVAVRLEEDALDAPLENLPYLYQVWGTLNVVTVLLEVAAELGYTLRRERLVGRGAGGVFVRILPDGKPTVVLAHPKSGVVVRLIPERTYATSGALRSISFPQRPDVAVEIQATDESVRVLLFDPKYKLDGEVLEPKGGGAKPKKVDIDKMHAYRDAIRDGEGRHVVEYAAILYPGPHVAYDGGIEALSARPDIPYLLREAVQARLAAALRLDLP